MNKVKICQLKYVYLAYGTVESYEIKIFYKRKKKTGIYLILPNSYCCVSIKRFII